MKANLTSAAFDSSRVARCAKQIVRLIHTRRLGAGDRLPPQERLRTTLKASNDTLSAAMTRLVEIGILTRKRMVGTVVADLNAVSRINWSIGLATFVASEQGPSAFFADLNHRLLAALWQANCRCTVYFRNATYAWPQKVTDFAGLEEDIRNGHLDGLIVVTNLNPQAWRWIEGNGVPMCYVGPGVDIPCGVLIDPTSFEQEALAYFSKEGCRRTALLSTLPHGKSGESPRAKLRGFDALEPVFPGVDAGRDFAMRLLAQSQGKRPDGLAITDDYVAMGLAAALAAAGNGYKPRIAVIANRYLPLAYALPVMSFELNPDELVTGTVELLRTRILDAKAPRRITTVAPRMENPQES